MAVPVLNEVRDHEKLSTTYPHLAFLKAPLLHDAADKTLDGQRHADILGIRCHSDIGA